MQLRLYTIQGRGVEDVASSAFTGAICHENSLCPTAITFQRTELESVLRVQYCG